MTDTSTALTNTLSLLRDAKDLLTAKGFSISNTWYHGTSSALVTSIQTHGLKRSGDKALKEATKKTMATIGNTSYTETVEPIFLTPSKELAYYWAKQTVRNRSLRIEGEEQPVVFSITLPEDIDQKVRSDVGAASLLMVKEGEDYMVFLASLYQEYAQLMPTIDLMRADRMDYLNFLGMAYLDQDIPANFLKLLDA